MIPERVEACFAALLATALLNQGPPRDAAHRDLQQARILEKWTVFHRECQRYQLDTLKTALWLATGESRHL